MELLGLAAALLIVILIVTIWNNVILALAAGILIIIFSSGIDITAAAAIFTDTALDWNTIEIVAAVLLITLLSSLMYESGLLEKLLQSLVFLLRSIHLSMAVLPTMVGILAVPGGAILSAPFVDKMGDKIKMSHGYKSAVNIFFRHLTIYFNPLSPVLIVVASMSGLGVMPIIKFHVTPVLFAMVFTLVLMAFLWPANNSSARQYRADIQDYYTLRGALKQFVISSSPIIIALTLTVGLKMNYALALGAAVVFTLFLTLLSQKYLSYYQISKLLAEGVNWRFGITVFSILVFGAFVQNSGALPSLADILVGIEMPLILIIVFTSVFVGITTGHPLVGAAILYPIFIPFVNQGFESTVYLSLVFTGLIFGYVLSPIHLCLIISNEYYKVGYIQNYLLLLPLQVMVLVLASGFAFILL